MADLTPSVLANSVMSKIYDVLTNGDETVPKSEDNFFTWNTPGTPFDVEDFDFLTQGLTGVVKRSALEQTTLPSPQGGSGGTGTATAPAAQPEITPELLAQLRAQDTAHLYMAAEMLARYTDFVPDVTKANNEQFARLNIQNNEGTLTEIYERVLRMSQVMKQDLPADVLKKIDKFRGLLQVKVKKTNLLDDSVTEVIEPSPLVKVYNEKLAAYEAAALEYNTHRIDALTADNPRAVHDWAINANIYRNRVKSAMADWISNGFKNDYEQIAAYIDQVMARDMTLLKAQYKDDLEKTRITGLASGADFFFTSLAPGSFARSGGWSGFGFASSDFRSNSGSSFSTSRWSASGGGGFLGIFGGRGGASGSQSRSEYHSSFSSERFGLSFEICQVPIIKPWFKSSFINSKTWRFDQNDPQAKSEFLSDGGAPPKGLLPAYPTSMIFIRKLSLTLGKSDGFSRFVDEQKSNSASGGGFMSFGPFFLGGSASHSSASGMTQRDWGYHWDGQTLTVPGMQCVGFKCHIIPKSPNPLPTIKEWV